MSFSSVTAKAAPPFEFDANGALVVTVVGFVPTTPWHNNNNYAAQQTDTEIQATPGAGLSLYITDITISTDTAMNIQLVRNTAASTAIYGPFYFSATGGLAKPFATPIILPANENLGITTSAAGNVTVSVQGFTQ